MKKIFNTLSIFLLLSSASYAQQLPANRSTTTKIADVLAQQPAEYRAQYLAVMQELEGFSSDDFTTLLQGLGAPGTNNAPREFATNSYAFYVMQPGKEQLRITYVNGLLGALDKVKDKYNRAYVLETLKFCAKNESIAKVATYLMDDYYTEKSARILAAIGTPEAAQALNKALEGSVNEKVATAVVTALGDLKSTQAEQRILALIEQYKASPNFVYSGLTALSKIGGLASYDTFVRLATGANFAFDKTNVSGLAVDYANTLFKNNHKELANKLASTLYNGATVESGIGTKIAALELLVRINPNAQKKNLMRLTSDSNSILRTTALLLLGVEGTQADIKKLASSITKLSPQAQESVLSFLAANDARFTAPTVQKSISKIKDTNAKVAAYKSLAQLNGDTNTTLFFINQLAAANQEEVEALKTILLTAKDPGVIDIVNSAITTANEPTQLALLDVLSKRSNAKSANQVFSLIEAGNPTIRAAAFKALPNVVNDDDFDKIVEALGKATGDEIPAAQQAAIVALQNNKDKSAKVQRLAANISRSLSPNSARYFPIFAGEGGEVSLQAVKNYTGANNPLKADAVNALASWSNTTALDELTSLLRTEKDPKIFNVVFSGFIKQLNASQLPADQKTVLLKDAFALAQTKAQRAAALSSLKATNTYMALVFASKYLKDPELSGTATDVVMNIAMDNKDFVGTDVRNWLLIAESNLSGSESSYLKEAIVRHLAEMPNKEGYVSLFNGKDLTGWKGLVENPIKRSKMSSAELAEKQKQADKKMQESWSAVDGTLYFNGHGDNIATVKQYGDFELLLDWKLDKNGKEPDAGVYLRGTPQVQMWDISRTNVGAEVGSGGLYNNQKNTSKPLKVADNPLGEWNTMKIKMVGERVWVWLNGELVVDGVVLENYWDRNQSIFPMEQIELQAHGSQVWYRDIYLKELPRKVTYSLSDEEKKQGFEMLFDGTNLEKWTSSPAYEINEEGFLRANPDAKFGKNIYTKNQYDDFIYRFEFKLTPGANNGVGIRTPIEGDAAYLGHEIQILDDDAEVYKTLAPHQYHGSVYGIIPAKRGALKPMGEWNEEEIRIQGDKIKVTLNGKVIVDGDLKEASKNGTLDKKNHPGLKNKSGHIGFLGHGSEVFFRNIRVKKI